MVSQDHGQCNFANARKHNHAIFHASFSDLINTKAIIKSDYSVRLNPAQTVETYCKAGVMIEEWSKKAKATNSNQSNSSNTKTHIE